MRRRIAINGFGRIGRLTFRCILERHPNDLQIVAINDPAGAHIDALLLQYDSIYGRFKGEVICEPGRFIVDGTPVEVFRERDWHNLPWRELGIHTVLECSGQGVTAAAASVHLERGARDVLVSAPAKGDDVTIVIGVNEADYLPGQHRIVSNGSCTTNCLSPVAMVLHQEFGLKWGLLSTVHSYTNSQHVQDRGTRDPREARAAALNIIPTSTGAAKALPKV